MKTKKNVFENNTKQVVIITNESRLSIIGNSIDLKPEESFNPLIDWIETYKGETLYIDINLDLINCRSVKLLQKTLHAIDNHQGIKNKSVVWYFKDEEDRELGDTMALSLNYTRFTFFSMN